MFKDYIILKNKSDFMSDKRSFFVFYNGTNNALLIGKAGYGLLTSF